jgi:hypothetical protein
MRHSRGGYPNAKDLTTAGPGWSESRTSRLLSRRRTLLFGLALFTVTLIAYAPALTGGFLWDEDFYVSDNNAVTQSGYLGKIWSDYRASPQYYPLVFTTYWIEYRLWGLHTLGYHVVNVPLHVGSAIVLGRLLAWLPDYDFTVRKATAYKSMRITWVDGKTSLEVQFYKKGPRRSSVVVEHSKLPDAKTGQRMKAYWGSALDKLQALVEA